jgi:hypothetical protein
MFLLQVPGTGKAADINKILDLRKNLGEHPMQLHLVLI